MSFRSTNLSSSDISTASRAREAYTKVNINVYGSSVSVSDVGRCLSRHKIWLQRPDWYEPQCTYHNPHFLAAIGKSSVEDIHDSAGDPVPAEGANLNDSLTEVYAMLTRDKQLKSVTADERLKTKLLPHQEKGLDFMIQREQGPIPAEYRLWQEVTHDGDPWFHHDVADIKSKTLPSEVGGGIIADEMGMGKTYSMVALIVRTLENAGVWSSDTETHIDEGIAPTKRLSRATLVVVPTPLLLKTWTDEIEQRLHVNIRVCTYHGNGRPQNADIVANHDVVLTTYHTLLADHNRNEKDTSRQAIIRDIAWYRIILDEAHFTRNPTTYLHRRVAELDAKFRWCLTGTPIQNSLEDLGALFAFLRIFPFDRLGVFRKCVSGPFSEGGNGKLLAQKNLARLLDAFCVRRTKVLLDLEDMSELTHYVDFTMEEKMQYAKTHEDMKRAMQNIVGNSQDNSRFGMFQAQLQERLLCNHGTFQHQFHWAKSRIDINMREDALAFAGWVGELRCSACTQEIPVMDLESAHKLQTLCTHALCSECQEEGGDRCPLCDLAKPQRSSGPNGRDHEVNATLHEREGYFRPSGHSSKLAALTQDLRDAKPTDKR